MNEKYEVTRNCNKELARCYVPVQVMTTVYDSREALKRGTLFPELYRPYTPCDRRTGGGKNYG